MRVVAGTARGRPLQAPPGRDVRPTTDRVREALFNALGSLGAVEGATVLDLFAGSGALAIEALSRGATTAVLVERDRTARRVIEGNLEATGLADRARVVGGEAMAFLGRSAAGPPEVFDLVLLDPPYAFSAWPMLLVAVAARCAPGAVVVVESDREVALPDGWHVERAKRYGGTLVTFARPPIFPEPR